MVDDRPDDTEPSDVSRAKRAPPTIDLEASRVSDETSHDGTGYQSRRRFPWLSHWPFRWPSRPAISTAAIGAVSGTVAAALVIVVASIFQEPNETTAPPADSVAIATLKSRIADLEAKIAKTPVAQPDPSLTVRMEQIEKSVTSLRDELAAAQSPSQKPATESNEVKSAAPEGAPDLSELNERLAGIERTAREGARPADDVVLRRVVVASLLDISVRQGDGYSEMLPAAKSLAPNPDALKPLDGFAAAGVPHAAALARELLVLVPKLSPPAQENVAAGSSILDRLQAGAARLVRIERTDTEGNDRGAIVARVTAAALRNDIAGARRELNSLAPTERGSVQAWIDKSDARDAALAAAHQFAAEAMTAFAAPRPQDSRQ
jgi:hypothetical protein